MRSSDPTETLRTRLLAAFDALQALAPFEGRLAGALAADALQQHDPVVLHLSAEHPDQIAAHLSALGIPIRHLSGKLHVPRGPGRSVHGFGFVAGSLAFEVWVLAPSDYRQRLRVASESSDLPRLSLAALRRRVQEEGSLHAGPAASSTTDIRARILSSAGPGSLDQAQTSK